MIRSPFETLILGMSYERGHRGGQGDQCGVSEPLVYESRLSEAGSATQKPRDAQAIPQ